MRCVFRPMRIACHALPIVLTMAVWPTAALAQTLVCHPIRRGESAIEAARRITGDSRNTYGASFQIMNASSRFIPKSQYSRIRAGWRACVIRSASSRTPANPRRFEAPPAPDVSNASTTAATRDAIAGPTVLAVAERVEGSAGSERPDATDAAGESDTPAAVATPAAFVTSARVARVRDRAQSAASDILRRIGSADLTMVWLGTAMVVPWFGWRILDGYLTRRRTASIVMQHFAHRFIDEFERPLVRYYEVERPLKSRVRDGARRGRFDILLAPAYGRRYPNLSDHKKNVEYDVERVMRLIGDDAFVTGPLYMQAGWVVVPFQPRTGPKRSGVTCISSF